jgi:hypothetical protein
MPENFDDPDVSSQAQSAVEEANEVANHSCHKIMRLWKKLQFMPIGSKVGSITSV